jgi:hypoxanthine phosphoribosyltransferase
MKKIYYTWSDIENFVSDIAAQLYRSNWRPDYIVGIHSGGNIPAVMLGKMLDIKTYSLDVRLRDSDTSPESNLWMSEDAFGYDCEAKKILIVDDINDNGNTIEWIKKDWKSSCLPHDPKWDSIWGDSVRIAVLVDNLSNNVDVDYHSVEINKAEDDCWLVFPWEEWYKYNA